MIEKGAACRDDVLHESYCKRREEDMHELENFVSLRGIFSKCVLTLLSEVCLTEFTTIPIQQKEIES